MGLKILRITDYELEYFVDDERAPLFGKDPMNVPPYWERPKDPCLMVLAVGLELTTY